MASSTGRFTPKGTKGQPGKGSSAPAKTGSGTKGTTASAGSDTKEPTYRSSGRYTAPIPKEFTETPKWAPWTAGSLLVLGVLIIVLNYMEVLPGAPDNWYLLGGLGAITGGFLAATQIR